MGRVPDFEKREEAYRLWAQYNNASRVSKEMGLPIQTIHTWKKDGKWEDRKARLQNKLAGHLQVLEKAKDNVVLEDSLQSLKVLELLEEKVAQALVEEKVRINSWKDVVDTMKFINQEKRLILGQPTERNVIEVSGMSEKDLDKNIQDLLKMVASGPEEANVVSEPSTDLVTIPEPIVPDGGESTE